MQRIKKRRIVQWAVAYLAAAWLLLQVAELIFDIFSLPDRWLRMLTVVLVCGFLAALVLAWYHGEKGVQRLSLPELGLLVSIAVATTMLMAVVDFGEPTGPTVNPFRDKTFSQLTATTDYKSGPTWHPDGSALVLASEQSGNTDLWQQQRSGNLVQLTQHPAEDAQPAWSPDGGKLLFVSSRDHGPKLDRSVFFGYTMGGDIWVMPAVGGDARKLVSDAYNPDWAPDGQHFAFDSSRTGPRRIWTAAADGSALSLLSGDRSDIAVHIRPAWSTDGRWIAYERQPGTQASAAELMLISADGQSGFALTDGTSRDMAPTWAGHDRLVFSSDRGGAINLWMIRIDFERQTSIGDAVQVTFGAGQDVDPAIASDGTLAYVTQRRLQNLWEVDVDPATWQFGKEPRRIMSASWNDFAPALSHDGRRIAYSSDRGGNINIWTLAEGASQPQQLTASPGQDLQPVWSPDDSKIAYFSDANGNNDIWIKPLSGGAAVSVTPANSNDVNPYWSPDGRKIGFASDRSGQSEIWTMDIDGGNATRLTDIGVLGHTARWSPDGAWLLFTSLSSGNRDVWATNSDGSELRRLTTGDTQDAHGLWSPDGRDVLYLADHREVFVRDFLESDDRVVFGLDETIDYVHLSSDGSRFLFTRQKVESDIWLIE